MPTPSPPLPVALLPPLLTAFLAIQHLEKIACKISVDISTLCMLTDETPYQKSSLKITQLACNSGGSILAASSNPAPHWGSGL